MIIIGESNIIPEIKTDSEFLENCADLDMLDLLEIMDDVMEDIRIIWPKKYRSIIKRMESLK